MDAAATVFARRGFRAASVDEVAAEAGLSKGAVYWNFRSKDDLFFALLEDRFDRPMEEIFAAAEAAPVDVPSATRAAEQFMDLLDREGDVILLLNEFWAYAVRDPELRARYADHQSRMRAAVARLIEQRSRQLGFPLRVPAEDLATAAIALANGIAVERLAAPEDVGEHVFPTALSLMFEGLGPTAHEATGEEGDGK